MAAAGAEAVEDAAEPEEALEAAGAAEAVTEAVGRQEALQAEEAAAVGVVAAGEVAEGQLLQEPLGAEVALLLHVAAVEHAERARVR
jgi:hypothetical protein